MNVSKWERPYDYATSYNKGDKIVWRGIVYTSKDNATVQNPDDFPEGWVIGHALFKKENDDILIDWSEF